jgi:hypothetical protein
MAGHEGARCNLGTIAAGNMEQGLKHFRIAVSTGEYIAMFSLQLSYSKEVMLGEISLIHL